MVNGTETPANTPAKAAPKKATRSATRKAIKKANRKIRLGKNKDRKPAEKVSEFHDSRPLDFFSEEQEAKLRAYVKVKFRTFKFLADSQDLEFYLPKLEKMKCLDEAFKAMGIGNNNTADKLTRARGWTLLAENFANMLREIKDTKIAKWRRLVANSK